MRVVPSNRTKYGQLDAIPSWLLKTCLDELSPQIGIPIKKPLSHFLEFLGKQLKYSPIGEVWIKWKLRKKNYHPVSKTIERGLSSKCVLNKEIIYKVLRHVTFHQNNNDQNVIFHVRVNEPHAVLLLALLASCLTITVIHVASLVLVCIWNKTLPSRPISIHGNCQPAIDTMYS